MPSKHSFVGLFAVIIFTAGCCGSLLAQQDTPQIVQATYGAGDVQMDVTEKIQSLVQSGQTNVRVGNHLFGKDPIFGKVKTLSILFSSNGVQYHTDIREGEPLSLSTATPDESNVPSQNQARQAEAAVNPPAPTITNVPSKELASGTTLWLLERFSVTTKTGVIGILPGSIVKVSQDNGSTILVSDGTHTFEVARTQVTIDPAVGERAAAADYASQVAAGKAREQSQKKLIEEKNKYWAESESAKDQRDKIRALESHYRALQEQESELLRQIGEAKEPLTTIYGGTIHNPDRSQLPLLNGRLNEVRDAKKEIKKQLEAAQSSN